MRKFCLFWCLFWLIAPTESQEITFETAFTQVIVTVANRYVDSFDYEKGRSVIDGALVWYPDSAILLTERGKIDLLLYEWDVALKDFNRAVEKDSTYAPAYFFRGNLYYTRTQREEAITDFEYYLVLSPNGQFATQAQKAIESIQIELKALNG